MNKGATMEQVELEGGKWEIKHATALLADEGATGKQKLWRGFVAERDGRVVTYTEFGQEGGRIQRSAPTPIEGKNLGKANETRPIDQAISEIEAQCTKKQKKGYSPRGVAQAPELAKHQERILPMLAPSKCWPERGHTIRWPCYIQPKLDGLRIATDGREFWSREGNLQNFENIRHLQHDTRGLLVDGEIILPPGEFVFQDTMSAIKNADNPNRAKLVFCPFDLIDLELPFEKRWQALSDFMRRDDAHPQWTLVTTLKIDFEEQAWAFFDKCIEEGLEGAMLRNATSRYRPGKRCDDLRKMKAQDDDEFEVVGWEEASGKDAGTPVWKLVTRDDHPSFDGSKPRPGLIFRARPMGRLDYRRELWRNREQELGAMWTVKYQGFYDRKENDMDAGKPRFPRAKARRTQK